MKGEMMGGNGNLRKLSGTFAFMGEVMTCLLCGKIQKSVAGVKSDWRAAVTGTGRTFYACPAEFPVEAGLSDEFGAAYGKFLAKVIMMLREEL